MACNKLNLCRYLALTSLILIISGGCNKSCSKNNIPAESKVQSCNIYNNDKVLCNSAMQLSGEKCKFDDANALCASEIVEKHIACEDMSTEDCKKHPSHCSYDEMAAKCTHLPPAEQK